MKNLIVLLFLISFSVFAKSDIIVHIDIKGTISPSSSSYLKEALDYAKEQNAQMLLVELDTPGGLYTSTREMIQTITNSPVPIIIYVSPKGAHAASAGTFLLYAAHIAAMSPGTNLGAATPINMMPAPRLMDANASNTASTAEKKALNDAMAYIKSLAQLNERNVTWALQAVKEAKSLSSVDALKLGVIDLIAENKKELIAKLDGKTVSVSGETLTLKTSKTELIYFEADWKTRFLSTIANPNIAYIFLLVAIYGIFFELMNPGAVIPGVIGAISGVVALYALNLLPFNYAGLLLIILGIAFMVAEVFIAGFGILGIGGVIAFAFGSLLLFDADTLGSGVSIPLVLAFSLVSIAFFILILRFILKERKKKAVTGIEEMVGATAKVLGSSEKGYRVLCHGEVWSAVSDKSLETDQNVRVESISGLTLYVIPIKE